MSVIRIRSLPWLSEFRLLVTSLNTTEFHVCMMDPSVCVYRLIVRYASDDGTITVCSFVWRLTSMHSLSSCLVRLEPAQCCLCICKSALLISTCCSYTNYEPPSEGRLLCCSDMALGWSDCSACILSQFYWLVVVFNTNALSRADKLFSYNCPWLVDHLSVWFSFYYFQNRETVHDKGFTGSW